MEYKNTQQMSQWLKQYFNFVDSVDKFYGKEPGDDSGIWVSAEENATYEGREIYDYYNEDYSNYDLGVLKSFEDKIQELGWYSEWYDAGTVFIHKDQ